MFPNLGSLLGAVDADKTPWLIWMGLGGSLYAFYWTFRASRDSFVTMKTRYATVAALAAMFVIAYLVWAEPARHLVSFSKKLDRCIEDYHFTCFQYHIYFFSSLTYLAIVIRDTDNRSANLLRLNSLSLLYAALTFSKIELCPITTLPKSSVTFFSNFIFLA